MVGYVSDAVFLLPVDGSDAVVCVMVVADVVGNAHFPVACTVERIGSDTCGTLIDYHRGYGLLGVYAEISGTCVRGNPWHHRGDADAVVFQGSALAFQFPRDDDDNHVCSGISAFWYLRACGCLADGYLVVAIGTVVVTEKGRLYRDGAIDCYRGAPDVL